MKINRKMNLVLPLVEREGGDAFVHSQPIGRDVYEANFELLQSTIAEMYGKNWAPGVAMRSAYLMMRKVAQRDGVGQAAEALLAEIVRLSALHAGTPEGWQTVPLHVAIERRMLDDDEKAEVLNALCYFTQASWFHQKHELEEVVYPTLRTYGAQIGSWTSTESATYLPTSTTAAATTPRATPSSIPQ